MLDTFLVPAKTIATAKGEGASVDVSGARSRVFLLTLSVAKIVEQEALDVSIHGSADGITWSPKPIASFPQKFYRGEQPFVLDLAGHPDTKFLRAHWDVLRWGRGPETPMFEFSLALKEIPHEVLVEARSEAQRRA